MTIALFEEKYLDRLAELFIQAYLDPVEPAWQLRFVRERLLDDVHSLPQYCLVALDGAICVGGIFCKKTYDADGYDVYVDTIHIAKEYQGQGLGKKLLERVLALAKSQSDEIKGVEMLVDSAKEFPKSWYKKLGLSESGWELLSERVEDIVIK